MWQAIVNKNIEYFELPEGILLLDVIRNSLALKGTKEACREGDCGSCIVLRGKPEGDILRYRTVNSCMFPAGEIKNSHLVTIEGLNTTELNPVQHFMVEEWASQCGFCTPGFVMSMTGYLLEAKSLNLDDAIAYLGGNICRCTGYLSIQRAMRRICKLFDPLEFARTYPDRRIGFLIKAGILPPYFEDIPDLFRQLSVEEQPRKYRGELVIGGGTDLYIQKGDEINDKELYFIQADTNFKGIFQQGGDCVIRAACTLTEMEESELIQKLIPGFNRFTRLISGSSIRNRATVGGNLINASPIGDMSIMFLALNAKVKLTFEDTERIVPLKLFFQGYKKIDIQAGELLEEIIIPLPTQQSFFHFEKVSRRMHLDIATVNTAISIRHEKGIPEEIHASAGGVGPVPMYLNAFCTFLKNKPLDKACIEEAVEIARNEISPISDVRGSKAYKRLLLGQLLRIHFSVFAEKNLKVR